MSASREGRVVWRDLMTTDVAASERFYGELLGWSACAMPAARFVPFEAGLGLPSHWVSYVSVRDVDRACELAPQLGGECCYPAFEDGDVGTFAMLADPGKGLSKPLRAERETRFDASLGNLIWDRLHARDAERAARFYGGLYGWSLFGGGGERIFTLGRDGVASLGPAIDAWAENVWVPHARVESVEETIARAEKLGASVVERPFELPSVGRAATIRDSTGALLGLLAPARVRERRAPKPAKPVAKKNEPAPSNAAAPTAREIFARTSERFRPDAAKGVRGAVQYVLAGADGGSFSITFDDGRCECREGTHAAPTATIAMTAADYVELATGKLDGARAVLSGRMKITGDVTLVYRLPRMLRPLR